MRDHEFELLLDILRDIDKKLSTLTTTVAAHDRDIRIGKMVVKGLMAAVTAVGSLFATICTAHKGG